ncbi:hypothetical protein EJ08DRAFT_340256 [Tothia fuscella]|uniref:Amine oxidase domain-containing protein n=1 Tax=Tothia fuscella TaxID=1048955 RepID=A0A9P4P2L8_9PEZI|nr:hypothetical protein EJ08DRAFT_340256 [Tothia fuscella]
MLSLFSALLASSTYLPLLFYPVAGNVLPRSKYIVFRGAEVAEAGGMQNVHIEYHGPIDGALSIYYGDCDIDHQSKAHHQLGMTHVGSHELAKRHLDWVDDRPTRFVWLPPTGAPSGACLHAYEGNELVGRSAPVTMMRRKTRRGTAFADIADAMGPWFDGVQYLSEKEPEEVFVAKTKSSKFGIIGGGMSGLMTSLLLDSVGVHDWTIIESSSRIGGRVHTSYLNGTTPDDYQYQEMGPMRFPVSIYYRDTNETLDINDHKMVFQLADVMNEKNNHDPNLAVNFIPWIQSSPNTPVSTRFRRPDGTIPGRTELAANAAWTTNVNATYSDPDEVAKVIEEYEEWADIDREKIKEIATNVFRAHKAAVEAGNFDYSESQYIRYVLDTELNITDQAASTSGFGPSWHYDDVYFGATTWRTIDKGLSMLPASFYPHVEGKIMYETKVEQMSWNETSQKMSVHWREDEFKMDSESIEFDYVVVAAPFSKVRGWKLPSYTSLLSRAINTLNYQQSTKVALHYKTRFWEHLEHPIIGGCGSTNIPLIGSVCYPAYKINSTGPGVLLASYSSGTPARTLGALTELDHIALVQRAMIEIHGQIAAEQWTGNYDRLVWETVEHQAGAWAAPTVGQQELYLPAYFHTEKHTIFIGEHTSYTHAWIFSALESAVRGTAQLLLDMGLVDEAKQVTSDWMARWMNV